MAFRHSPLIAVVLGSGLMAQELSDEQLKALSDRAESVAYDRGIIKLLDWCNSEYRGDVPKIDSCRLDQLRALGRIKESIGEDKTLRFIYNACYAIHGIDMTVVEACLTDVSTRPGR